MVTDPVQTLIDLATELAPLRLERAANEADKLDLVDPERLRRVLGAHRGQPGVKTLATLLDRHTFRLSGSDLAPRRATCRPLWPALAVPGCVLDRSTWRCHPFGSASFPATPIAAPEPG